MRELKKPEERRQEIIDTAKRLFIEKGYAATQVKDIVGEINVAQGLFYYYFTSKEAIFEAVAHQYADNILNSIRVMLQASDRPAQEKLFGIFALFIQSAEKEDSLFSLIQTADSGMFHEKVYTYTGAQLIPLITALAEEGSAQGVFHCDYPVQGTHILVHGILSLLKSIPQGEKITFLKENLPALKTIISKVYGIEKVGA